jgi:hypothetical protein
VQSLPRARPSLVHGFEECPTAPLVRLDADLARVRQQVIQLLHGYQGKEPVAAHAELWPGFITFGADYSFTTAGYGQGFQFATTPLSGGPFGPDSTYCDTMLTPAP